MLRPLTTSYAKDYKGHSLVQTSFTEPPSSTGIAWNELICGYANVVYTSSDSAHTHTHTHTLIPFEDCKPTGLIVDIATGLGIGRFRWGC